MKITKYLEESKFKIQRIIKISLNLFNGVYSRTNVPKIKDDVYVMNLDEFKSIRTHWIALNVNGKNIKYFDSFEVEHIPKKVTKFIENKKS